MVDLTDVPTRVLVAELQRRKLHAPLLTGGDVLELPGFRLDPLTGECRYGDRRVHLGPRETEVFALIAEHYPRAVPSRRLGARLWPGMDSVRARENLRCNVYYVRRRLGPGAIENASANRGGIGGYGAYRLVLPATATNEEVAA